MAVALKKAPRKKNVKAKPARSRRLLTADELKAEEKVYLDKDYKIVKGTLRNRGEDPGKEARFEKKRSVEITCGKRGCDEKRRIATSDLWQVKFCEPHTLEDRAERKNENRRNKTKKAKATKKAPKKRQPK